jgi:putative GTP pyrophosphokinase
MAGGTQPSKGEINRAGDRLRQLWLDPPPLEEAVHDDELFDAFDVLVEYRRGFQDPLKKVTMGLRSFVQREMTALPPDGKLPVGQRLKRERQIIRKLARHPRMALARMQDIGGCRAIPTGGQAEVEAVLRRIRKNWEIKGFKDYVAEPAPSGYRAIHVVVLRDGHLIEIQLRTPLQHAWAEAVERTGFRLREDLKEGEGPPDLLRYFHMAAEGLALEEAGQEADEGFMREFDTLRKQVLPYFVRS